MPTMLKAPSIHVLRPGALTLVQDLGRPGHGASGVPRGGAFDPWAAREANRRVGNPDGAALLEVTLAGPTLELEGVGAVALVGDPFELAVEGAAQTEHRPRVADRAATLSLQGTTRIAIGRCPAGARAWLAVAGGIDVPVVLGSRSTDLAGGFGGFAGRALRAGDLLTCFPAKEGAVRLVQSQPALAGRAFTPLRIVPGPDARLLVGGVASLELLELAVTPHSDRRGIRMTGGELTLESHASLRSQGTLPGAVQIPPSGLPIVLGVDAPVTGGYPWVAQVIEADLGLLAHLAPGAPVRFEWIEFGAAESALVERQRQFEAGLAGA